MEARALFAWICFIFLFFIILNSLGAAVTKSIRAVVFVFRPQRDRDTVRVNTCSGWARHRGGFRKDGTYKFILDLRLSDGDAQASLLDGSKQPLFTLSGAHNAEAITLTGKQRYYLRWEFQRATGTCELRWTAE